MKPRLVRSTGGSDVTLVNPKDEETEPTFMREIKEVVSTLISSLLRVSITVPKQIR